MGMLTRVVNLCRRKQLDAAIDAELVTHMEMKVEALMQSGMCEAEARRAARVRFGNPATVKEQVRGADAALELGSVWADFRFACRQLRKAPGFACTAVLVLTLGIGASIAIFAFADAVLIRPLPYERPEQLVALYESTPLGQRYHLSYLDYLDWKRQNEVFSTLEAYDSTRFELNVQSGGRLADGAVASAGFFRALGVQPVLGRDFRAGEDSMGAPRVAMLSYAAWQNRYGGHNNVVGQTVTLDGNATTIVGVLPREFYFPPAGSAEFWTALRSASDPDSRGGHWLSAVARLKDGTGIAAAQTQMNTVAARLAQMYPGADGGRGATVASLPDVFVGKLRPMLTLLLSCALLLLLIACINVSSLLLVRAESRRREMAVRGALGATRARLVRQLVTESLTLAAAGTAMGTTVAYGAMHLLTRLIPAGMLAGMPYLRGLGLSGHVLAFTAVTGLTTAVVFSLTSMARLRFAEMRTGLTEGGRSAAGKVWRQLGANLVVMELATAMVLLVGAGLLGKSFYKLLHTDIGLDPRNLAIVHVNAPEKVYAKTEQIAALTDRVMNVVRALPGVEQVAVSHSVPVANLVGGNTTFEIMGRPGSSNQNEANGREVSAGFFSTVGARLLHGRAFTQEDVAGKPQVAIVNRSLAQKYFLNEDVLGKKIRFDSTQPWIEIVGEVENLQEGPLDAITPPALYLPFAQSNESGFVVVARTTNSPGSILKPMTAAIELVDQRLLTYDAETMVDRINQSQSAYLHRSSAWLVAGFAAVALLLGVVGLYGVVAYSVSQRTREIGVRMALGAQRGTVYRLVLREAAWLTAAGLGAGLVCSLLAARVLRTLLFGTQPWDAATLAAVAVLLGGAAMLASFIPARRAAAVNPMEALRAE